jgi:hypothetical protein
MKVLLTTAVVCISMACSAQDCSDYRMQKYSGDTTVTVDEARRIILTSFAAINSCNEKLKLSKGNFYYFTAEGSIGFMENFDAPLDDATKLKLIAKLKPGVKLMLENMQYGEQNKLVPTVSLTLVKGRS